MSEKNGFERSGTVTRSFPERKVRRFFAVAFGTYPRSSTAFMTLRRVPGATMSGRLSTRDTVAVETPARLATSKMFGIAESFIGSNDNKNSCRFSSVRKLIHIEASHETLCRNPITQSEG